MARPSLPREAAAPAARRRRAAASASAGEGSGAELTEEGGESEGGLGPVGSVGRG
jgi:hypothetical protein